MRRIQLRRGGAVVSEFDIYDLAQKGDKSHDVQLLPGDVIYIPAIGPQVAISGNVNEPGIYELKDQTTVSAALEGAGGLTSLAGAERVLLERIDNHSSRRVEEFTLDASNLQRPLKDGDLLRIFPLSPKFENAVTLRGNVAQPGRYVWKEGMRVSDLIPSRDFLITRNFWNRENHLVPRSGDHQFGDQRTDLDGDTYNSQYDQQGPNQSRVRGISRPRNSSADQYENGLNDPYENRRDDQYEGQGIEPYGNERADDYRNSRADQSDNSSADQNGNSRTGQFGTPGRNLSGNSRPGMIDTVGQNSAEVNWEYAVIERLDDHDLSTRLIPFRLAGAIDNHTSGDNQLLKSGDVVTIFSRADLDLPMEKHASFVRVGGEVNAPGVYRVNPGETLKDVVEQAGGLTPHSYLYASLFTRVSTRKVQEEQLRQSSEQMQRELTSRYANATPQSGETGAEQQAQLAMQQAALAKLSTIKPTGRVVLEMKPDAATLADIPDFSLEDGDTFYIPPRLSTVQVSGAVYNANAFRHEPEKRLVAYLNDAGGATREADQKRIFVIRADGTVVSRQGRNGHGHGDFERLKLLPGDAIVVPQKLRVSSKMNDFLQITQFASQTALTAAALSVIQ
jgi:protein involved in polysaccharide export with SLBB domain/molybdopterin converting factor small subunit